MLITGQFPDKHESSCGFWQVHLVPVVDCKYLRVPAGRQLDEGGVAGLGRR